MRQVNRPVHYLSRPVEVMVPNAYNRAALDVTSTLPLSITLTNLRPMIFNLRRIREVMTSDGGLEALVEIASTVRDPADSAEQLNRKIALQCLNRIGVCGPEAVRVRTVEAQILPVLVSKLECFWRAMDSEIRHAITYELYPPPKPVPADHSPPQAVPRRRALTTGSSPMPMEGVSGPRIVNTGQTEVQMHDDPHLSPTADRPLDIPPGMERLVQEIVGIDAPAESNQETMEIDCNEMNEPDNESGLEDPTNEVEPLQSSHSEPHGRQFPVASASATTDHTDLTLPTLVGPGVLADSVAGEQVSPSPRPNVLDPVRALEGNESVTHQQITPEQDPSDPTNDMFVIPVLASTRSTNTVVPPNAPLLGHTTPGAPLIPYVLPRLRLARIPIVPSQAMSALYSRSHTRGLQVPTREEILDCLECLGQLSKLPKLRPHLNCTRFVPNLLHDWLRAEDLTKEVNLFEIVERFTACNYHPEDVRRWAQVVMRHYNRKDAVMRHRQCGNLKCGKLEPEDRRFILCPLCKYSSPSTGLLIFVLTKVQAYSILFPPMLSTCYSCASALV
jgi:hypothetical protein